MNILIKMFQYKEPEAMVGITKSNLMSNYLDRLIDKWVFPDIFIAHSYGKFSYTARK
jgi:hypothetical protein